MISSARYIATLLLTAVVIFYSPYARACPGCGCVTGSHAAVQGHIQAEHEVTRAFIDAAFTEHRRWHLLDVWEGTLLPGLRSMTNQMTATAMQQTVVIGTEIDARQQLRTQRLFQEKRAEAHKDYQPSTGLCSIGTNTKSLAAADRNADFTTFVLSQRSQDRQMGNKNAAAAFGNFSDRTARINQFKAYYCNTKDNVDGLARLCGESGPDDLLNFDVNYARTVAGKGTLDIDFITPESSTDSDAVFALANNLYANDVLFRFPEKALRKDDHNRQRILDMRNLIAKESVAEHAFNAQIGMKAEGTENAAQTAAYMKAILAQIGIENEEDIKSILGDRPSYDAQMKLLTQTLYQRPEFYTDLYDKPVNVERKKVALQAIGLMQDFDTWDSYLRTEAILSVLLEMELLNLQRSIQQQIDKL